MKQPDRIRIEIYNGYIFKIAGWKRPSGYYDENTISCSKAGEKARISDLMNFDPVENISEKLING